MNTDIVNEIGVYLVVLGAAILVGISLIAVSVYCISNGVDARLKRGGDPFPLQLIAFIFFIVGGCLVVVGCASFVAYPLLYN